MILCDATDGEYTCVRDPHEEGFHLHRVSEHWLKPWPDEESASSADIIDILDIAEAIGKRDKKEARKAAKKR